MTAKKSTKTKKNFRGGDFTGQNIYPWWNKHNMYVMLPEKEIKLLKRKKTKLKGLLQNWKCMNPLQKKCIWNLSMAIGSWHYWHRRLFKFSFNISFKKKRSKGTTHLWVHIVCTSSGNCTIVWNMLYRPTLQKKIAHAHLAVVSGSDWSMEV